MIKIEHEEEYVNRKKVKDYYNIIYNNRNYVPGSNYLLNLSLKDLQKLYDKLGEIINKKP